eukprot:403369919
MDNQTQIKRKTVIINSVLLGESGVGKTSLIQRYVDKIFELQVHSTIGLDFKQFQSYEDGIKYTIKFWDTAGQERFKEITKKYLRKKDCYVFVFDHSNLQSFEQIEKKYIKQMMEFSAEDAFNKPLFLVGNKSDIDDEKRVVRQVDIFNLAKNYGMRYFEVSCKLNENVNELFEDIKNKTIKYIKENLNNDVPNIQLTDKVDWNIQPQRNCKC